MIVFFLLNALFSSKTTACLWTDLLAASKHPREVDQLNLPKPRNFNLLRLMLKNVTAMRSTAISIVTVTNMPSVASQAVLTIPPIARTHATSAAVMEVRAKAKYLILKTKRLFFSVCGYLHNTYEQLAKDSNFCYLLDHDKAVRRAFLKGEEEE